MKRKKSVALAGMVILAALNLHTRGGNIPTGLDVNSLRTSFGAGEGYLRFHQDSTQAEERNGWTDIRHPAYFNGVGGPTITTTDNRIGYDRSSNQVTVQNVIVTDSTPVIAAPAIASDYNFANAAYAQIGISVIAARHTSATYNTVTDPINGTGEDATILAGNRMASPIINNYYIQTFDGTVGAVGVAYRPEAFSPNTGTIIENPNGVNGGSARVDTFAHEVGHMLIDDHRFSSSGGPNQGHSGAATDLMSPGGTRTVPTTTPKSAQNDAPKQVGNANGNLGGRSLFNENISTTAGFNGGAGPFNVGQPTAIYNPETNSNTYVQRTHDLNAADRADFQWSEDNKFLEQIGGLADQHAGADLMRWVVGASLAPDPTGKDFGTWGTLNLPSFTGPYFRYVDVVSNIARYADMDVGDDNEWSERESALDYYLEFSADGTNWLNGTPIQVFTQGWTAGSDAENFIARWLSPVNAVSVRIGALSTFGADGNTQIDALIAFVPEPSGGLLAILAAVVLAGCRKRVR